MKLIVDGKNAVLGRLASYVAKQSLKGEEIVVINCGEVIITGKKENIKKEFEQRRRRVGTTQQGPKFPRTSEKIVKRTIRGMLPDYRGGRGRVAYKKIKCYFDAPKEFEDCKKICFERKPKKRFAKIKDVAR